MMRIHAQSIHDLPAAVQISGACVLGMLSALAFAPFSLWPLLLLCTPILWHCIVYAHTMRRAALLGTGYGIGISAIGISWLFTAMTHGVALQPVIAGVLFTVACILFALPYAVAAIVLYGMRLSIRTQPLYAIVILPTVWLAHELLRTFFYDFPWLLTAHALIDSPFATLAPIGGEWAIGFIGLFVVAVTYGCFIRKKYKQLCLCWLFVYGGLFLLGTIEHTTLTGHVTPVTVIQGNIASTKERWHPAMLDAIVDTYVTASTEESKKTNSTRLLLWPETAIPVLDTHAPALYAAIDNRATMGNSNWIIGLPVQGKNNNTYYSALRVFGKETGTYTKHALVPFGEYVPFADLLESFAAIFAMPFPHFARGDAVQSPLTIDGIRIGASLCFEGAFAEHIRRNTTGTHFLLNASNEAWFGDSNELPQLWNILRLRAAENGRFLVRATNTGMSGLIDRFGKTVVLLPPFEFAVRNITIPSVQGHTPYQITGNIPMWIVFALVWCAICIHLIRQQIRTVRQT